MAKAKDNFSKAKEITSKKEVAQKKIEKLLKNLPTEEKEEVIKLIAKQAGFEIKKKREYSLTPEDFGGGSGYPGISD